MATEEFLYDQIVSRIGFQIESGVLKPGDRMPSVRALSREQNISLSTAFRAYSELEKKGLVEARPKSGFYVRAVMRREGRNTAWHDLQDEAVGGKVDVQQIMSEVYRTIADPKYIRFSLAAPSAGMIPVAKLNKAIQHVTRHHANACTDFDQVRGNLLLRQQVAKLSFNWGGMIAPEDIITTHGCLEAIVFCLKAVTKPGDLVAIESPTYFGIFNTLQHLGLKTIEIPSHPANGLQLEALAKALDQHRIACCLFVPTFNNPLGSVLPDEDKERLVDLLSARDVPLIEDDTYGELYFGRSRPLACKHFDRNGTVMYCSSITKTIAPGYRVGWCIPGKYFDRVLQQKMSTTVASTTLTHAAIGHFMESSRYDLHMRHLRKQLHLQSLQYLRAIQEYFPEDIHVLPPKGSYTVWIKLPASVNAYDVFREALRYDISIAPGQLFSADGKFSQYIRISYAHPLTAEVESSLRLLGQIVARRPEAEYFAVS